jgi:hypothetical protein
MVFWNCHVVIDHFLKNSYFFREIFSWGKIPYPAFSNEQVVEKVSEGYRMNPPPKMNEEAAKLMGKCWEQEYQSIYFVTYK